MKQEPQNYLYYGDNIDILRRYIKEDSVDLIYLDPPFNSKRDYNVTFHDRRGKLPASQVNAFYDSWHWNPEIQAAYDELLLSSDTPVDLKQMMHAFRTFLRRSIGDENDMMAYLTMMAMRLVELHRVLKTTGTLYLHCDPTASHYLKLILDQIFGVKNFLAEIVWCYSERELSRRYWNHKHDIILFYAKDRDSDYIFNWQQIALDYSPGTIKKFHLLDDAGRAYQIRGRNVQGSPFAKKHGLPKNVEEDHPDLVYRDYLDEKEGVAPRDWIADIPVLNRASRERLGYPTQKPQELLERLIRASSNEGDVVLDPFCGCGTAIAAAEKLNRRWIGIDITYLAITLIKKRLQDHFPDVGFKVIGEPKSTDDAIVLASQNKFQFEAWAVSLLGGQPVKPHGGGDSGIDGLLYFQDFNADVQRVIIEVKGGKYEPKDIRALRQVMERENAPLGVFIVLNPPTKGMIATAAGFGSWKLPGTSQQYPVMQLFTIEEYFAGKRPVLPDTTETFKRAKRLIRDDEITSDLF